MRKLGLDYGESFIGIALTDLEGRIASPCESYRTHGWKTDIPYLARFAHEQSVDRIVIGLPLMPDGTEGERCAVVRAFAERLGAESGLPISFVDERMTTVEADAFLAGQCVAQKKRKRYVDKLSAQIILRSFLEAEELRVKTGRNPT